MGTLRFRVGAGLVAVGLLGACGPILKGLGLNRPDAPIAVDSDVTFAAHPVHDGYIVDRLSGGGTGSIVPRGGFRFSGPPTFLLNRDREQLASLLLLAPATVEARATAGAAGRVEPSWEEDAIRLTLRPPDGPAFRTDVFQRTATSGGWSFLTRGMQSQLDMRGTFRGELRDPAGKSVGWIRVRISPYQAAARIYDAALPAAVGDGLAAGAVVALSTELDWIEGHTQDPYRGDRGGPLQQSIPIGK